MNLSTPFAPRRTSRSMMILVGFVLIATVGFLMRPPAGSAAATFNVNSTLDTVDAVPGDGICADALNACTLRAAVMEANALVGADTINVPAGTYTLTLPAQLTATYDNERLASQGARQTGGDLDILSGDLTIVGASAATTIIQAGASSAAGIDRVFDVNNPRGGPGIGIDVTFQNLTIRNGNSPAEPVPNSSNTIRHNGGAIKFDGFDAPTGLPKGKLTIKNCVISGNTAAGTGGGISLSFGSMDIDGTTVSSNSTPNASGGGIMADAGSQIANQSFKITNSTISANNANNGTFGNGGGLFAAGNAPLDIATSHIVNNSAGVDGGGVAAIGFTASNTRTITKTRFENNSAARGDALFRGNSTASFSALEFTLNVVVGNNSGGSDAVYSTVNTSDDSVDNNWWGCNEGPNAGLCDRIGGAIGFGSGPFLMLRHSATPAAIDTNQSTTLEADFFQPSMGSPLTGADLVALNGRAIVFNNAVLGTISGADTQISAGKANATYTAGNAGGTGSADATVDHATATAFISIARDPEVTTNPTDQTKCEGDSVSFTAASSGFPTPTVQWQVSTDGGANFTDISGATNTTLTFTAQASQNGNQYRAVFTNVGGSATTSAATLTVNTDPVVTTNPADAAACEGGTVSFTAAASGSPSPSVQWQASTGGPFADLAGETNNTLTFNASVAQNGNRYRAVFTNACATATTTAATLTVKANTTATTPANQTVCQGAMANFSTTASGEGPFSYQWRLDGANIAGATSDSLALDTTSVSVGSHTIEVVVTGACNSVTKTASLTVQENTAATKPGDQTVCQGATANFATTASGTNLTFQWKLDGNNINGATSSSVAIDTSAVAVGNHTVEVVVSGSCGTVTKSASLTVQRNTTATTPGDQTVCQGGDATFSTTANGDNLMLQWRLDGNDIPGATGSSVVIATGSLSAGNHSVDVVATGSCGSVTRSANLTVNTAPVVTTNPVNQTANPGDTVTFTAAASGQPTPSVQWQVSTNGGGSFNNIPGATNTSYSFTAQASDNGNQYRAVFTNSCGSATTTAATLTTCTPAAVVTHPTSVAEACVGSMVNFTASGSGSPAPTVQWQVSTNNGGSFTNISGATSTTLTILVTPSVRNNQYRAVFTNNCGTATTNAATLGVDSTAPVITLNSNTITLWPPNHSYHTVNMSQIVTSVSDNCDSNLVNSVVITSVSSDEPENGGGDGNTSNDIIIAANCKSVQVRAERENSGNGRVYRINVRVTDSGGNVSTATAKVYVPRNQNVTPIDNGPGAGYTVNSACP